MSSPARSAWAARMPRAEHKATQHEVRGRCVSSAGSRRAAIQGTWLSPLVSIGASYRQAGSCMPGPGRAGFGPRPGFSDAICRRAVMPPRAPSSLRGLNRRFRCRALDPVAFSPNRVSRGIGGQPVIAGPVGSDSTGVHALKSGASRRARGNETATEPIRVPSPSCATSPSLCSRWRIGRRWQAGQSKARVSNRWRCAADHRRGSSAGLEKNGNLNRFKSQIDDYRRSNILRASSRRIKAESDHRRAPAGPCAWRSPVIDDAAPPPRRAFSRVRRSGASQRIVAFLG